MANTIDWGQGAVNNTIDWGKGKTNNTINWGAIYDDTPTGETNIIGGSSFTNTYSMSFDGVDEYFNVGTSSLGITGAITVSAWVKIPTTNTGGASPYIQMIVCEDNTSGGQRNWALSWRGTGYNYFSFQVWHTNLTSTSINSTGITPNDNQWHHLLGTFDGTTGTNGMKFYIDGVLNGQTTATSTGINSYASTETTIGALTGGGGRRLEGTIDEVAIWNSDQNTNAATIYNSGTPTDLTSLSPLSWWRMGDGDTWQENLFLYSNDFTNAYWAKSNITLTSNAVDSPIGTLTATKLVETAVSGIHLVQKGATAVPLPITRNASIYLKAGERTQVYLDYNFGFGYKNTIVDLSSGSIVSSTFTNTPTLTDEGDGWYRFDYYETNTSTSVTPLRVFIYNGGISYLGDGTSGVYIAGAQWVDSTEVGNYIETTTSTIQNWTLTDNGSAANNATSVNMEEADRVTDVP